MTITRLAEYERISGEAQIADDARRTAIRAAMTAGHSGCY